MVKPSGEISRLPSAPAVRRGAPQGAIDRRSSVQRGDLRSPSSGRGVGGAARERGLDRGFVVVLLVETASDGVAGEQVGRRRCGVLRLRGEKQFAVRRMAANVVCRRRLVLDVRGWHGGQPWRTRE